VFGSNGAVISKYSKSHIYDETLFDQPEVPEVVVFPLDEVGLNMGTIICVDIEYHAPLAFLPSKTKFHAFTCWWASNQPPMLTAPMIQQSVSYVTDMTIIAGNALNLIAAGGGIFSSGEILGLHWNSTYSQVAGAYDIVSKPINVSELNAENRNPPNFRKNRAADIQALRSLLSHIEHEQENTHVNLEDDQDAVPCSVSSIALPGMCKFVNVSEGPQFFNISINGVRCVANITFDLSPGYENISNYALFATNYDYPIPATTDLLAMQSCFLMRCESNSNDPSQPIACNKNLYTADALVTSVDIFGAYNCSEYWNPPPDGSNAPSGKVLPMVAIHDAQPVNASVLTHSQIGCIDDLMDDDHDHDHEVDVDDDQCGQYDVCWFRIQVPQPLHEPVWSIGMYGINGKAGF
jgi:hypothetical protein